MVLIQGNFLRRREHQLGALNQQIQAVMPKEVADISQELHVAFLLCCMILLRWPAVELIDRLGLGVPLSGV